LVTRRWTNQCTCGNFMPDGYDRCDYCLLEDYGLLHERQYDSLDQRNHQPLYKEQLVIKALREAEKERGP